jgi:hypothetical protein
MDLVLESGLRPSDRNKIHLSATPEKAYSAGRVHIADPLLLEVDVKKASDAGNFIFRAGKSVYITDAVEPEHLAKFEDEETMEKLRAEHGSSKSDAEKAAAQPKEDEGGESDSEPEGEGAKVSSSDSEE